MKKGLCILLWLFIFSFPAISQDIFFKQYTLNDGLPSDCVRKIFKDSRSLLWIGTDDGLSCFDGHKFINYSAIDGLEGNKIWAITEDKNGNIWLGSYGRGISVFDGEKFTLYNTSNGEFPCDQIRCLKTFPNTELVFIGTEKGAFIYDGHSFSKIKGLPVNRFGLTRVMDFEMMDGKIIIALYQNDALHYFDPHTNECKRLVNNKDTFLKPKDTDYYNNVSNIYIGKYRHIISYVREGIYLIENNRRKTISGIGQVFEIQKGQNDDIWLAAWVDGIGIEGGGLYLLRNNECKAISPLLAYTDDCGFSALYDSTSKALWYGSTKHGLFYIPLSPFSEFWKQKADDNYGKIKDLCFDEQKNLWVAATNNILCIGKNNRIIKWSEDNFLEVRRRRRKKDHFNFKNTQTRIGFSSLYKIAPYEMLIGHEPFGLFKIKHCNSIEFIHWKNGTMALNEKGELLMGGKWSYLFIIKNITRREPLEYKDINYTRHINDIISNGKAFWIATQNDGLLFLKNMQLEWLNANIPEIGVKVNCLCKNSKGVVFAANSKGQIHLLKENNQGQVELVRTLNITDKTMGHNIRSIHVNEKEELFASTNKGLIYFPSYKEYHEAPGELYFFDASSGYGDYSSNCCTVDSSENLYLGTDKQIIRIDREILHSCLHQKASIRFTSFSILNTKKGKDSLISRDRWTKMPPDGTKLKYNQNYIGVSFSSINYLNPSKDRYSYFLEGYEKEWSPYSESRTLRYSNIPYGDYVLRIKAINLSGMQAYDEICFPFSVLPPFWKRWWFYSGFATLIILIILLALNYRIRSIRKKEKQKAEIARKIQSLEIKALTAQMNPHFVFNAITSIQNCILDNNVDSALQYLSEFSSIIRLTLENVNKDFISLSEELDYINYYLSIEKLRFRNAFEAELKTEPEIEKDNILIPPMIIQPHIENAIHHGLIPLKKAGHLKIAFSLHNENTIKCIIEDNGIGRAASHTINEAKWGKKHISRGSRISRERIELYRKTENSDGFKLEIIDLYKEEGTIKKAAGTRVILMLPCKMTF